jgi:pantetheine-phosphate adenylyltransferase
MPQLPRIAIVPGSFDPLTNGHVDLIRRAARLFDRVVVGVLINAGKQPLFSPDERVGLIRDVFRDVDTVEVQAFDGLLVEFARRVGAVAIVRGLRSVADFEYEEQMTLMNRHLAPAVETVSLTPDPAVSFISSRLVKEVASYGGAIDGLVPPAVAARFRDRHTSSRKQNV